METKGLKANKKPILISLGLAIFLVGIVVFWSKDDGLGKTYTNKVTLCRYIADSYLKTVAKTDGFQKEQMAVDVETDLYNLCLVDLNKDSLQNFKLSGLEKYKNGK